jgi:hypothetical protein
MGFWSAVPIIGKIIDKALGIVDQFVTDKDLAARIKAELQTSILAMDHSEFMETIKSQKEIIVAEANATSWLTKSWRPIVMLTFAGILVMTWFGLQPEGMPEWALKEVFVIIKIGLGGYVIGRSFEKTVPGLMKVLKKND